MKINLSESYWLYFPVEGETEILIFKQDWTTFSIIEYLSPIPWKRLLWKLCEIADSLTWVLAGGGWIWLNQSPRITSLEKLPPLRLNHSVDIE